MIAARILTNLGQKSETRMDNGATAIDSGALLLSHAYGTAKSGGSSIIPAER